jgi:RNA-directed DNA polymerase
MTTRESAVDKWKAIPWKKLQKVVFRLQVRIYKAQKNGNALLVRKLQKLLLSSKAAKLLAIRQVTQLNMGKRTKGVDNKSALSTAERLALYEHLFKNWKQWKHQPLKRVFIPKADGTQRGLGIPTISDRAYQCLLKYAEAKTKLVNSTDGFDFLGFHLKVKPNGKFLSTPSQASYRQIKDRVKETMKDNRFNLKQRIAKCGLIVRGWRNYHKFCDMSADNLWFSRYWTWKYIRKQGSYDRQQTNQVIETAFPPVKWSVNSHINVQGDKSPFDGDTIYWSERSNKSYSGLTANLMKRQKHTCNQCGLKFFPGDIFELHHIDGDCLNQKRTNMEILHRGCHQHQSIHREVRVRKAV